MAQQSVGGARELLAAALRSAMFHDALRAGGD
jgi:hypothetical protein